MISREQLERRKAELMADYHALSGAIQDCDYWLEQIEGEGVASEEVTPAILED